jgi:hypothetical protein
VQGKKYSHKKLIVFLLEMRDFPSAFEYMDEYALAYPDDAFSVKAMKAEIEVLLSEMEEKSKELDETNIIWNWIDNVPYSKLSEMPWVESQINGGIRMENAYSVMPWTTWITRTMFSGENPISGRLYSKGKIGEKTGEYPLLDYLKEQGYHVLYSCYSRRGNSMFTKEYRCEQNDKYVDGMSTRYQWFGICRLLQNKSKSFVILHNIVETHAPYASMNLEYMDWRSQSRRTDQMKTISRRFLDDRIKWYSRFYGNKTVKIWMSDHGDARSNYDIKTHKFTEYEFFNEEKTHTVFGVSGSEIKKLREKRYFQADRFWMLLKYLIEKSEADYENMFHSYVTYENYPIYSKWYELNLALEELEKRKGIWQQFIGVRDDEYEYIRYYDGSESFYVLPDEKINKLENSEYAEVLSKFRAMMDEIKFINIFEEDKFVESRKIYERIGVTSHVWGD